MHLHPQVAQGDKQHTFGFSLASGIPSKCPSMALIYHTFLRRFIWKFRRDPWRTSSSWMHWSCLEMLMRRVYFILWVFCQDLRGKRFILQADPNSVSTLAGSYGEFRVSVILDSCIRVRLILWQHKSSSIIHFLAEISCGGAFMPACRICFWTCAFFVAGGNFQDILRSGTLSCLTVQDFRRFSSEWQAWHFLHVAETLASGGRNWRWFRRAFIAAGAVFGELGRCFVYLKV